MDREAAVPVRILLCGLPIAAVEWLTAGLAGVIADVAASAPVALDWLASRSYGAVVIGYPPFPDGEEVLARVAAFDGHERPRLIGLIDPDLDREAARRLVVDYHAARLLIRPLEPDEFVRQVGDVIGIQPAPRTDRSSALARRTQAAIAGLWPRFESVIRARVQTLDAAAAALLGGTLDVELRERARRDAHKLAGSLGTFGMAPGTRLAREAETLLGARGMPRRAAAARLRDIAGVLAVLAERGPDVSIASDRPSPRVLLVDDDARFLHGLALAAAANGYVIDIARSLEEARAALALHRPQVAVINLVLEGDVASGHTLLRALSAFSSPVPVVALTPRRVLNDRVEAARLGARIFLQKPIAARRVLTEIASLMEQLVTTRPRILAVDDDSQLLATIRTLLENEGLEVTPLSDPLEFWNVLETANPDLVILDVDMPSITGIELCRVIRSDPRWCTLPVLFLTGRTDSASVHRVFAAGADDYVSKPVVGPELVTRIRNRLERLALLRKLSDLDALTGVPNRRRSIELIEQLQRLAERHRQPLCFVLLDVDRFKKVNDNHGHGAGDEVLHALAEFLERQFRGDDVVGRWGGEEFALGLFGVRRHAAAQRVRRALKAFSNEEFRSRDGFTFRVTVSAGVSEFPSDGVHLEDLYRAADEALYRAKGAGRDRVEEAAPPGPLPGLRAL